MPVVYLTAYANGETLGRAKVTEPFGYVLKPFEEPELRSVIEMALYKHQAERELGRASVARRSPWPASATRSSPPTRRAGSRS